MAKQNKQPKTLKAALKRFGVRESTSVMQACEDYQRDHSDHRAINQISVIMGGSTANKIFAVIENWPGSKNWFNEETGEYEG